MHQILTATLTLNQGMNDNQNLFNDEVIANIGDEVEKCCICSDPLHSNRIQLKELYSNHHFVHLIFFRQCLNRNMYYKFFLCVEVQLDEFSIV